MTDGNARASLAIVRGLGAARHHVIVGDVAARSLASKSRYCRGHVTYRDPHTDVDGFVRSLQAAVRQHAIDVLLPVTDVATAIVVEHASGAFGNCAVPLPSASALARASDKWKLLEFRLGDWIELLREFYDCDRLQDSEPVIRMLNKGPLLLDAVSFLDHLLTRMSDHLDKKSPLLRRLRLGGGND